VLTDEQCEQLREQAAAQAGRLGPPCDVRADRSLMPGWPEWHGPTLRLHPEDYRALRAWALRRERDPVRA
jgi:hypothetical protein